MLKFLRIEIHATNNVLFDKICVLKFYLYFSTHTTINKSQLLYSVTFLIVLIICTVNSSHVKYFYRNLISKPQFTLIVKR